MGVSEQLQEKIQISIQRLTSFEPKEGYHLAFSGGKDSCVVKALADMAGVKYHAVYRVTGIDPPELVYFIKRFHQDVKMEFPRDKDGKRITLWSMIENKQMPPTRLARYCCENFKESSGDGEMTITGVRWAESQNRKNNHGVVTVMAINKDTKKIADNSEDFKLSKSGGVILVNDNDESRRMVEQCYKRNKTTLNPIIDWTDSDVWEFIRGYDIPYCCLYDEGFKRLGCIGCPLGGKRSMEREFARYPKYKELYIKAFEKMLKRRKEAGKDDTTGNWASANDVFNWWIGYDILPGQVSFFEDEIEEE